MSGGKQPLYSLFFFVFVERLLAASLTPVFKEAKRYKLF
jgi:hypothetical protein